MAQTSYGNRGRQEKRFAKKRSFKKDDQRSEPRRAKNARTAESRRDVEETEEMDGSDADDDQVEHEMEDDDDVAEPAVKSYSTLLQSLKASHPEERQAKRRKIARDADEDEVDKYGQDTHQSAVAEDLLSDLSGDEAILQEADDDDQDAEITLEADDDEPEDESDPYEVHFGSMSGDSLAKTIKHVKASEWKTEKQETKQATISTTRPSDGDSTSRRRTVRTLKDLRLKKRLIEPAQKLISSFSIEQQALAPAIFHYEDLLYGGRSPQNAAHLRTLTSLHALNHIFKGRDKVVKNNERLARSSPSSELELRDQGFTRPKVLILLETRSACARYVDTLMTLCEPDQQENKKRFQDAFGGDEDKYSDNMPADYKELFEGNDDNDFRVGVKLTRKNVKFYSQFYASDIILASPLGLRRIMENEDAQKADSDFLSSMEVVVVDQADAMLMQNWDHVDYVFSKLNLQPRDAHGCDFSRVRNFYLDDHARFVRQTIILSSFVAPELNRLFNNTLVNVAGKTKITPVYPGAILQTGLGVKQTFSRYDSPTPHNDPDARFAYFTSAIVPSILKAASTHGTDNPAGILIFIPSYFDFVRVRNYFAGSSATENLAFGAVSEYTSVSDTRRARSLFLNGRNTVLLYSGRAHHFHRYRIKGVKRVVFYSLPENPLFYTEAVAGFLGQSISEGKAESTDVSARAVFARWDALKLERIVGSDRVRGMLRETGGDTFDFV